MVMRLYLCMGGHMAEIHRVLESFPPKLNETSNEARESRPGTAEATFSDIPDVFFDEILQNYHLNRYEIQILLFFYRQVWCRPNLYKKYGISSLNSLDKVAEFLGMEVRTLFQGLKNLENYEFISTIRSGQYFVRRYFSPELDELFRQNYDEFTD